MKKLLIVISLLLCLSACTKTKDIDIGKEDDEDTRISIQENNNEGHEDSEVASEDKEVENEDKEVVSKDEEVENEEIIDSIPKLNIVADENGQVLVVMYHGIKDLHPYHIKPEEFKKDLQYMYDNKYMPIKMSDYISGNIDIAAGYTPIVLTFDDGLSTTCSLERVGDELVASENCAVAIMEEFYEKHEDFARNAIFYINTDLSIFASEKNISIDEKLSWLTDRGYEIGTHTATHKNLSKLNESQLNYEIGSSVEYIHSILGENYDVSSIAYPFGSTPKSDDLMKFVLDGRYNEQEYHIKSGFAVGVTGPIVMSYDKRYNKYKVPRVRGSNTTDSTELWDYFERYEKYPEYRFISDGFADKVTIFPIDYNNIILEKLPVDSKLNVNLLQIFGVDANKNGVEDCIRIYSEDGKIYYQNEDMLSELTGDFSVDKLNLGEDKIYLDLDKNMFLVKNNENLIYEGKLK